MSSNGYSRSTTPNIDQLAKESLVFHNAFAHASWTLPESISIYTGLYPFQHGVMNRYDGSTLAKDTPTFLEPLKRAGYVTAAFVGGFDYKTEYGLGKRFDTYTSCQSDATSSVTTRKIGDQTFGEFTCTIPKAIDWLKNNASKKFFLHVQGFDAHCPFSQKGGKIFDPNYKGSVDFSSCLRTLQTTTTKIVDGKTYWSVFSDRTTPREEVLLGQEDVNHLIAIYDEAIKNSDQEISKLLEELRAEGLEDKTIIIFTSEHGDMFGEHGRFMRGGALHDTFYDEVLNIPLIIKHPKIPDKRINGFVGQIDLAPTVLAFLGLTSHFRMEGKNLIPLILDNHEVNSEIFAGSVFTPNNFNPWFTKTRIAVLRNKEWKLVSEKTFDKNPSELFELYNIAKDKSEATNLSTSRKDVLEGLQAKLTAWVKRIAQ